ncbi:DnaA/Hda family protein [Lysinibacillus sp. FSL R7-0073]|uniref:DnaA ATPase domain-containing protein n=1 Tax=Lysinibacillus sp. FSL R7-0073 TaxID=2921669 RepID=UPI0030FC585A
MQEVIQKIQEKYLKLSPEEVATNEQKEFSCPKCKDVGGFFEMKVDEDERKITYGKSFQIWVDCSCEKQKIANKLIKASEITDNFKAMTFANYYTEGQSSLVVEAKDLAMKYFKDFEKPITGLTEAEEMAVGIAVLGQPGFGKTHLLSALSNNMMQKKLKSVLYFPYVEGFDDLRDDFEKLQAKLIRMKEVDILFIDDLFKPVNKRDRIGEVVLDKDNKPVKIPQASSWEIKQIYSVVNYRYMNKKPVFLSSELEFDQMILLDEALGTRLYQMCKRYFLIIDKDLSLNYRLK